jgi:UDP-glucose 4-epimerase
MRREVFIFKWLYAVLTRGEINLEGGNQTRDVTYIDDVIDACILVMEKGQYSVDTVIGEKYIISYGQELQVTKILDLCLAVADDRNYPVNHINYRPGEMNQRERFVNAKARSELGYEPKVGAEEAIKLTFEWLKEEIQSGRIK